MEDPRIKTTIERDVKEHEVFLSFDDDSDAHDFKDWWTDEGSYLFDCWVRGIKP